MLTKSSLNLVIKVFTIAAFDHLNGFLSKRMRMMKIAFLRKLVMALIHRIVNIALPLLLAMNFLKMVNMHNE